MKRRREVPRVIPLTPEGHYEEAARLLFVIDDELQQDAPCSIGDLAVLALAHAVTALAGQGRQRAKGTGSEEAR